MVKFYKPYTKEKGLDFDVSEYSKFKEHENSKIKASIEKRHFEANDFAKWVANRNVNNAQKVRLIPQIMRNDEALNAFLKDNITAAEKVLHAAELASADLSEYPYDVLASALYKRLFDFPVGEIQNLANDENYSEKLWKLQNLKDKLDLVLSMIEHQTK